MRSLRIIFLKDLMDTLRDRRALIVSVLMPILLFPLLMLILVGVQTRLQETDSERTLRLGIVHHGNAQDWVNGLRNRKGISIVDGFGVTDITGKLDRDEVDAVVLMSRDYDEMHRSDTGTAHISLYYRGGRKLWVRDRISDDLDKLRNQLQDARYSALGISRDQLKVVEWSSVDLSSVREILGMVGGGFVPYFFVLIAFVGCMQPAVDLGVGEKERGSMETLLCAPVGKLSILGGKFFVVACFGLMSALLSVVSLFASVQMVSWFFPDAMPAMIMDTLWDLLRPGVILLIIALLIPICAVFGSVMLCLSMVSNSFKEAQSLMSPLLLVVIVPVAIGLQPGLDIGYRTLMIPFLNVTLITKAIIAGSATVGQILTCFGSMGALAIGSLLICRLVLNRETVWLRNT